MSAGSLTLGGNLSIAVGPLGRNGEAIGSLSTSGKVAAMYSYSKTRGLFGGVSIEGSVIVERQDANAQAYRGDVSVKALLSGAIPPPEWASSLIKTLEACTGMPGNRRWVQEFQAHHGDDYVFNGMESTRTDDLGLTPTSSGTTYADVGSVRPKKSKSRSSSFGFPPTSWGKRKGSGSYFESEFHDPSRAPIPVDQSSASSASAKRSWEDRPSPRWNRPLNTTTGYFDTKFESDYVSDEQLRRHPRLSTLANEKAKDPDEFQDGSPSNSLPPFDAARSSLTGSDATSHRRAFSAYAPRQASKTGADLFDSSDVDLYGSPNSDDVDDFGYGARSLSSARSKSNRTPVKLTAKTELTRPLMPHEGVVRAIALFTFRAVQPGDLSFEKGQVITVTEKSEDTNTWWKGKVDGREGVFPANFVEVV
ncbi:hypothetical protein AcW1_001841 [Taiwanofungus camphoratus]|nr:hypothetical protein AcV5_000109 [Antrodia cinnamomea]KAI0945058.1 hypothetical protein AcV7_001694 [Antrodia cinnamomea]KAI0945675.1 hypothetical protein AcW1_001841 [Antrodia cinnamomea]